MRSEPPRQLLAGAGAQPRRGAQTQALRALLTTRGGAVRACTAALNELRALIVACPPELRERLQGLSETALLGACVRLHPGRADSERAALALALRSLALRVRQLRGEARTLERELDRRVQTLAPCLLAHRGVGPISAAALLVAWSQPGRLRSEAAFARLAGVAPDPGQLGQGRPPPAPPRRRSPPQPGAAHDRPLAPPPRRRDQGLHRPPRFGRQK